MENLITAVSLLVGLLVGGFAAWFFLKYKDADIKRLSTEVSECRKDIAGKQYDLTELRTEYAQLEATLQAERKSSHEKLQLLGEAKENLRQEFENLANKIFDDKSRRFTVDNKEKLQEILGPLREQLGGFKKTVEEVYDKETRDRVSLLNEIKHLKDLNQQVSQDAINLTNALKGESKTQGNWGELVLERVLEQSGLKNGREYETQLHLHDAHGGNLSRYPDVVIHLPEKKDVVVDAKVSLTAYERFCNAGTEEDKAKALKAHTASIRTHIAGLSAKNYEDLAGINSLDLVVMCIPSEAAFLAAVADDQQLYDDAFRQHIVLASPSTLLLILRIIATIWKNENQNRNAIEIADRGRMLYEKFVGFVDKLSEVGRYLDSAKKSYDDARSQLSEGTGNLVGQAQKLIDLGVKAKKKLPRDLLESGPGEVVDMPDITLLDEGDSAGADNRAGEG